MPGTGKLLPQRFDRIAFAAQGGRFLLAAPVPLAAQFAQRVELPPRLLAEPAALGSELLALHLPRLLLRLHAHRTQCDRPALLLQLILPLPQPALGDVELLLALGQRFLVLCHALPNRLQLAGGLVTLRLPLLLQPGEPFPLLDQLGALIRQLAGQPVQLSRAGRLCNSAWRLLRRCRLRGWGAQGTASLFLFLQPLSLVNNTVVEPVQLGREQALLGRPRLPFADDDRTQLGQLALAFDEQQPAHAQGGGFAVAALAPALLVLLQRVKPVLQQARVHLAFGIEPDPPDGQVALLILQLRLHLVEHPGPFGQPALFRGKLCPRGACFGLGTRAFRL